MSLSADAIVELFERDARARKRLAELLVSEPDVRLAVINAVLRDVATRGDVERVREDIGKIRSQMAEDMGKIRSEMATRSDLDKLRGDLSQLRERVSRLEGVVSQLVERIGDLDKRMSLLEDSLNKRIDSLDKRIDALDKRIDSLDKRIDYVARVSWLLTGAVIATLIANIVIQILG